MALAILPAAHAQPADLAWGAAAGVVGGAGLFLFYRALAAGTMSVVAPIAGVTSIAVPVIVRLAAGERPGLLPMIGVGLAALAIACVSGKSRQLPGAVRMAHRSPRPLTIATSWSGIVSGIAFGLFFVLIHRAAPAAGLWPLVAARHRVGGRLGTHRCGDWPPAPRPALGRPDHRERRRAGHDRQHPVLARSASWDAERRAALASLYPATTLLLARVVLRERLSAVQGVGLAVATAAVLLISAG